MSSTFADIDSVFPETEMVVSMKNVANMDVELKVEERNLLSVAYKNVIGARRASWRIISSIEHREEGKANEKKMKMIQDYRQLVKRPATVIRCPRESENVLRQRIS